MTDFVSIIVPIYNVSTYIEQCAVSLFEQDFEHIEYIFVNDATPDNSVAILEQVIARYPHRKPYIKILHHSVNKGLGFTRNTGLRYATGEYTIHIDSDDWCELDMVSSLYQKAKETQADIVYCDMYENCGKKQIRIKQQAYPDDVLFNKIVEFKVGNSLWTKLIKRTLYTENDLYSPTHISMAEDRWLFIRLAHFAKKIVYLDRAFLHYRKDNPNALTMQYSKKSVDELCVFLNETKDFLFSSRQGMEQSFYTLVLSQYRQLTKYDRNLIETHFPEALQWKYVMNKNVRRKRVIKGYIRYQLKKLFFK